MCHNSTKCIYLTYYISPISHSPLIAKTCLPERPLNAQRRAILKVVYNDNSNCRTYINTTVKIYKRTLDLLLQITLCRSDCQEELYRFCDSICVLYLFHMMQTEFHNHFPHQEIDYLFLETRRVWICAVYSEFPLLLGQTQSALGKLYLWIMLCLIRMKCHVKKSGQNYPVFYVFAVALSLLWHEYDIFNSFLCNLFNN